MVVVLNSRGEIGEREKGEGVGRKMNGGVFLKFYVC